ncbi:anthranilate phosphoribosyltransferase [Shewanella sp.]|uniref:anthranilate phosphoribosyltransferase n=1 Tax=Shewanella sp. TaxID=50422 RepID=UPI003A97ED84
MSDVQTLLEQLYRGESLSREQAQSLFQPLVAGELNEITISALLTALKIKGETIAEITGAADALLAAAKAFPASGAGVIDIVGTGGDGYNTINISTTSCFVAAAAGAKVAKHGNRGVSSKSGASDLLSALGINLTMSPETAAQCLDKLDISFLFAPHYHGGVRYAVPVRQALKTRTIFNVLGPLINPSRPDYLLLGVYSPALVTPLAGVLKALGVKRAIVAHGSGLDEIAVHGESLLAELKDGEIREYRLQPEDFGVERAELDQLVGGTPEDNAAITKQILAGTATTAQINAVAVNAGSALYVAGISETIPAGVALAKQVMASGKALALVEELAQASNQG